MDQLGDIEATFDRMAEEDPLWAVLSDPAKAGKGWVWDEFMATGVGEVEALLADLDGKGVPPGGPAPRAALDFGCGVGRLTQALAGHFETVDGVDVSARMVALAEGGNRAPGRCRYHHNTRGDLMIFPAGRFDLVVSLLVFQHIPRRPVLGYLREFGRILRPGGVAVFDVPSHRRPGADLRLLYRWAAPEVVQRRLRALRWGAHGMSQIFLLPRPRTVALLQSSGLQVVAAEPTENVARGTVSYRYTAIRRRSADDGEDDRGAGDQHEDQR